MNISVCKTLLCEKVFQSFYCIYLFLTINEFHLAEFAKLKQIRLQENNKCNPLFKPVFSCKLSLMTLNFSHGLRYRIFCLIDSKLFSKTKFAYLFVCFGLVWVYCTSTIVGYLMPNPFYTY